MLVKNCFFFKQKTAYEMRISDWSSDVCSSDLRLPFVSPAAARLLGYHFSDIHLPDVVDKGRALRLPIKAGPCPLTRRRHIMGHQVAHRTEISINLFVRDRSGGYAQLGTDCVRYISKANAFFRRCMITSTGLMPFQCQTVEASNIVHMRRRPPVCALTGIDRYALGTGDRNQVRD